jgi:hypothetical protein
MRQISFFGMILAAVLFCGGMLGFTQQLDTTNVIGGGGGDEFFDFQPPAGTRVAEVRVRSGETIDAVQMVYELPNGRTVMGSRHGGTGGRLSVFRLDPDEYVIGLSGRFGVTVDSLSIQTNRRTSEQLGGGGGDRNYRIDVPPGYQAVGFVGRAGNTLDAVGLTYAPMPRRRETFAPSRGAQVQSQEVQAQYAQTQLAGGRGGSPYSDQDAPAGARIAEVRVCSGRVVDSVQVIYALPNGRLLQAARHGGANSAESIFRLDNDEYIIGLAGRYGNTVDSMRIITNKRTSPQFGGGGGDRDFRIDVPSGNQAIGFAGRAGDSMDAIGLTYARITFRR